MEEKQLDLRLPSGLFFAVTGVVLMALQSERAALTDLNVNLWAGLSMLVFGAFLLVLAWRNR